MADGARRPGVFTIPPHVAFIDALARGLLDRTADDPMRLARGLVLLPNRRAVRALTDAFVRQSEGRALLLPRMTPLGDVDEDEALGTFADDLEVEAELALAVEPTERRLLLTRIVRAWAPGTTAVEALRLADALARTLDGLGRERKTARELTDLPPAELAGHWQRTLAFLQLLTGEWPGVLAALGKADRAGRAAALLDALARRWSATPSDRLVVAAGIVDAPPAAAALLHAVARLPDGLVVLPGLDISMDDEIWRAIRCRLADAEGSPSGDSEGHPQFAFRCLLARLDVGRGEVEDWPFAGGADGPPERSAAVTRALAPARFTDDWAAFAPPPQALAGVSMLEAANPAEEAQAIALALRRQLDVAGKTAALVTPDRLLARRVAAHLRRYGVSVDDSAGVPLRVAPPGTLVLALVEAASQSFAPTALLALLKHPLVSPDGPAARQAWLAQVRALDLALRGIRPEPGLDGVGARIEERLHDTRAPADPALADWWRGVAARLEPLEAALAAPLSLEALFAALQAAGAALAGEELWRGPAGRALSELFADLAVHGGIVEGVDPADAPPLVAALLQDVAVRAPGRHPRLAVYGLLEARLQRADLMILGGLNEGMWPALPSPDPWLAPAARAGLGLPGLDRRIGLSAHDFAQAMGAPQVLLTRARRDDSAPTVPSRFWLRLTALAGPAGIARSDLRGVAHALDIPAMRTPPAARPRPAPDPALRPRALPVTAADKLKADPYSFYAERMLKLRALDPLDQDPSAADRGTFVHEILEDWVRGGRGDLAALAALRLRHWDRHPLMRALWVPRAERMMGWVAETMRAWEAQGWTPLVAEADSRIMLGAVTLRGRPDRIDRAADGSLAVIDYKTGGLPSHAQLEGRFALQLGLLAHMAEAGAFGDPAPVSALRYWKLSGGRTEGQAKDPLVHNRKPWTDAPDFAARSAAELRRLIDDYLLGPAPFTAKLHPEYATAYTDYDHLARVAEWWGRRE